MLLAAGAKGRNSILPAKRRNHLRSRTAGSCIALQDRPKWGLMLHCDP